MARPTIRLRLARAILGRHAKDFIPPLSYFDRFGSGFAGQLNDYRSKSEQLDANIGWCFAANNAIVEPSAAVKLKLYRRPLWRRPQLTPLRRRQSKNLTPFGDNSQSQQRLAPVSLQVARAPPTQTIIVDQHGGGAMPIELQKQEPQRQRVEVELRGFEPPTP